jgi:hypothetical protein
MGSDGFCAMIEHEHAAGPPGASCGFDVLVEVEDVAGVVGGLERPQAGELGGRVRARATPAAPSSLIAFTYIPVANGSSEAA